MLCRAANSHPRLPASHVVGLIMAILAVTAAIAVLSAPLATWAHTQAQSTERPGDILPQPPAAGGCGWSFVSSPNLDQYNALNSVAAVSPSDVWAVGSRGDSFTGEQTLIERWDGTSWSVVPSPNRGGDRNELLGVTALSASSIWAVGHYRNSAISTASQTFVLHWDGSAWTYVPSPSPASLENEFSDIDAASDSDIWAVGHSWNAGTRRRTHIQHWDGTQWSHIPSPSVGEFDNYLTSVSVRSASDVWAVGGYISSGGASQTLALHWDGTQWSIVSSPNVPGLNNYLNGVSALSQNDAWAVGYTCAGNCFGSNVRRMLILRWNGSQWSLVPTPAIGSEYDFLSDVLAMSSNDVWAVGLYTTSSEGRTLVLHWDGSQWSLVPSPNPNSSGPELRALSAVSSSDVWAVGFFHYTGNPVFRTLTEHYAGPCSVSSPTPAPPTPTPTPTAQLPTSTATATQAPPTSTPTCTPAWRVVPSSVSGAINGIAAISANDVWAVGSHSGGTLTMRWDGSQWSVIPSPNPSGGTYPELLAVSAIASNDVWAVGSYYGPRRLTLAMHWDGTQWSIVPSPNPGAVGDRVLYGVTARASNDVWAVGSFQHFPDGAQQSLIARWNGSQWTAVSSPSPGSAFNILFGVSASSASSAWAVGMQASSPDSTPRTLTEYWDGSQWSLVPSPNVGTGFNSLSGVSMLPNGDAWAVGSGNGRALILRWSGAQWEVTPYPEPPNSRSSSLDGVAAISPNDVWAVGSYLDSSPYTQPLIMHWNGTQWSVAPDPIVAPDSRLSAISAISSEDIWASGRTPNAPLFERYSAQCGTATPSATSPPLATATITPTRTAVSTQPIASSTPTLQVTAPVATASPTSMAQATPSPCAITFSDVPADHTFYTYVRCLACRGILGGYSDGTFRPNNDVTRGQLSKIVANAARFYEPVSGQTFSDVPVNHVFYEYIERMARRGIISGYSDGTFRPYNPATRGQISKIVSNAAGFQEPVSGQTFTDVPPTHTFYEYIERMARRGIIGGYSDGTFRPQNNATRGQTSKIVSNTFFPACNP